MDDNLYKWAVDILNSYPLGSYDVWDFASITPVSNSTKINGIDFVNPAPGNEFEEYVSKELWRMLSVRNRIISIYNSNERNTIPKVLQKVWFDETIDLNYYTDTTAAKLGFLTDNPNLYNVSQQEASYDNLLHRYYDNQSNASAKSSLTSISNVRPYDESTDSKLSTLNKYSLEIFIGYLILYHTTDYKSKQYGRYLIKYVDDMYYVINQLQQSPTNDIAGRSTEYNELLFHCLSCSKPNIVITFIKIILNIICNAEIEFNDLEQIHNDAEAFNKNREKELLKAMPKPPNGNSRFIIKDIYALKSKYRIDLTKIINNYDAINKVCEDNFRLDYHLLLPYLEVNEESADIVDRIFSIGSRIGKPTMINYIKYVDSNFDLKLFNKYVATLSGGGKLSYKVNIPTGLYHYVADLYYVNDSIIQYASGTCVFLSYFLRLLVDDSIINDYNYKFQWVFQPFTQCRRTNDLTKFNVLCLVLINVLTIDYSEHRDNKIIMDSSNTKTAIEDMLKLPHNEANDKYNVYLQTSSKFNDKGRRYGSSQTINDFVIFQSEADYKVDFKYIQYKQVLDMFDKMSTKAKTSIVHKLMMSYNNMKFNDINSIMCTFYYKSDGSCHEMTLYKLNVSLSKLCDSFKQSNENANSLVTNLKNELHANGFDMFSNSEALAAILVYFGFYYYSIYIKDLSNDQYVSKLTNFVNSISTASNDAKFQESIMDYGWYVPKYDKLRERRGNDLLVNDVRYVFKTLDVNDIWLIADINMPLISNSSLIDLCMFSQLANGFIKGISEMCFLDHGLPVEYNRLKRIKCSSFKPIDVDYTQSFFNDKPGFQGFDKLNGGNVESFMFILLIFSVSIIIVVLIVYYVQSYMNSNQLKNNEYSM